jgi:glycosyltransferase involved in cell wall biosynthesis
LEKQIKRMKNNVSVLIPAYNEEHAIEAVLKHIKTIMAASSIRYEVIVIDDGSQDRTAMLAEQQKNVVVLKHSHNRGYGAAIKTGIRHARYEIVCITDADGTYPNERIPEITKLLAEKGCDMVVGARTGAQVEIPLMRRPAKWLIGKLASMVADETIPDINSGLRAIKRSAVLRFWDILPDGFSFTTTITLCLLTNDCTVNYVPIDYYQRVGTSKIRPIHDTLNFIRLVLRIGLYFAPMKIFLPLSGILMAMAVAWGFYSFYVLGRLADVSTLVMVLAAFQVAVMGLLADLIDHRLSGYKKDD